MTFAPSFFFRLFHNLCVLFAFCAFVCELHGSNSNVTSQVCCNISKQKCRHTVVINRCGKLPPGQLSHMTTVTQDNCYPESCHRKTATWTTVTQDNCHADNCHTGQLPPGQLSHRTTVTQDNCHPDNCHTGQLPRGQLSHRTTATRTTVAQNNCHTRQLPPGQLSNRTTASRAHACIRLWVTWQQ